MNRGITVAGNLVVDYVKILDSYPIMGNLSSILSVSKSLGGAPPNVLIDLARMDPKIPLKAIGVAGNDEDGQYIVKVLKEHNIDTSRITTHPSLNTSFTDVMTVESTGARTFFHYRGANSTLSFDHFDFENIDTDILHIGYALLLDALDAKDSQYGTVMARTLKAAQDKGIKTSLDVVSENSDRFSKIVPPSLKYCNYFIVNEVEASLTVDIPARDKDEKLILDNMKEICRQLMDLGVNDLVVIHSPEGGFAMDKGGEFYIQPSLKLPDGYIKGTVGAGDAFCAGVLYSLYNGWSITKALQTGVSAAACCLAEVNATDGMKDIDSVLKLYESMELQRLE